MTIYTYHVLVDDEMWWYMMMHANATIVDLNNTYPQHPYCIWSSHLSVMVRRKLQLPRKKGLFRDLRSKIKKSATTSSLSFWTGREPAVGQLVGNWEVQHQTLDEGKYRKSWLILTWFLMSNSDFHGVGFQKYPHYPVVSSFFFHRVMFTCVYHCLPRSGSPFRTKYSTVGMGSVDEWADGLKTMRRNRRW